MIRKLVYIVCMLFAIPSYAADHYVKKANPTWTTHIYIKPNIILRSQMALSENRIAFMSEIFDLAKYHFFEFTKIDPQSCYSGELTINIINEDELDSREYFPHEYDYSEGDLFVLGRYFRHSNQLYVVPPHLNIYYWRKTFAHELLHYFYDDCGIKFKNDNIEHKQIEKFMRTKRLWFY